MNLTLSSYIQSCKKGELTPKDVRNYYINKAQKENQELNAFASIQSDYAERNFDALVKNPFYWAPIGIKDNILTKGYIAGACSNMLKEYVSTYSATCFSKLEERGACMIGKTNMDEFAMWASSEYSSHGVTKNPYDTTRVAWGTSWWSAAAVAADLCVAALGTDTGWSVRMPAALCGVVWCKPTYGRISRYGVIAMASSFDQVGTLTKTVEDAEILLETMSWYDLHDSTSIASQSTSNRSESLKKGVKGMRIALPEEFMATGLHPAIRERVEQTVRQLQSMGAIVEMVKLPLLRYALAVYYVLVPAEVSTNLSKYDWIRYGEQGNTFEYEEFHDYTTTMRSRNLGPEVKRRILTWVYVMSSANYDGYFLKAQKVRMLIKKEMDNIFSQYDLIIGPTSPEPAREIGEKAKDPLRMYLADVYTVLANIVWLPAISVPSGTINEAGKDLPVGIQLIANQRREDLMFTGATAIESIYS